MFNLQQLIRKNILNLQPYSSARSEYSADNATFLDANENPYGSCNRYPDPYQSALREKLAKLKGVTTENIVIGNGSDELIDLVLRIFCEPGIDQALTFKPTYGMYRVAAAINNIELVEIALDADFQLPDTIDSKALQADHTKVAIICSPNNPTGNVIYDIDNLLQKFDGIVVVDEAYIDFAQDHSYIKKLQQYPNLIVLQTLSKAWGMAGARVGIAYASPAICSYLNKTKPPYNVSQLNQQAAISALDDTEAYQNNLVQIQKEKKTLIARLTSMPIITKIYPSDTNFLLVETLDADYIYQELKQRHIIVRNRKMDVANCLRITIGTPDENRRLITALYEIQLSTKRQ